MAPRGATDSFEDLEALQGFGGDAKNVLSEAKHGVKGDTQDLGIPAQRDVHPINRDIRADVELLSPRGEQRHL